MRFFFGIFSLTCLSSVAADRHNRNFRSQNNIDIRRKLEDEEAGICEGNDTPVILDFNNKPDGTRINSGDYVSSEWKTTYGLLITAEGSNGGGHTPDNKARILDSYNPGEAVGLGSPNNKCNPTTRGPGKGSGGRPGTVGENCVSLGNVLLIQDTIVVENNNTNDGEQEQGGDGGGNGDVPPPVKDYGGGGIVSFTFDKPTDVISVGVIDINTSRSYVRVYKAGRSRTIRIPRLGNNSVQQVLINEVAITKVEVYFRNYGAITDLQFCPPPEEDDMDLGFRFNKFGEFDEDMEVFAPQLPLTEMDYPLSYTTALWLSSTEAISVVRQETCGECDIMTPEFIASIGGLPTHPSGNPEHIYWDELLEVIDVQIARTTNQPASSVLPLPKIWSHMDIHQVAEAVHDEFPGIHHIDLLETFIEAEVNIDRDVIPSINKEEFLRGPVLMCDLNGWSIGTVGPHNFGVKWYTGRARPEEAAMAIKTGDIPSSAVPQKVKDALSQLNFTNATEFTAYPEGSPRHPSWPAMHSAASAGSLWMAAVLELTPEQWCEAKAVDYGVAYARTVAGVHFASDNIAGLNLGQEILARKLPSFLAARYGSDPVKVKKKIETIRFNWNDYLTSDCFLPAEDN